MSVNLKSEFLSQVSSRSHFEVVFDHLPGVSFFAKNQNYELVVANRAFWERLGCASEEDLIGKNDFELFPARLAEKFRRDDEQVMETGKPKLKIIELFFNRQGLPDWYFTNKFPVFGGKEGEVIGVMGTVQSYTGRRSALTPHLELDRAVSYLREHFREPVVMADLARMVGMSVRQFNRRFRDTFGTNPTSFLIKTRIQAACEELRRTGNSINDIALDYGFYDQSSFTQHFRKHVGMTPLQYRKRM